MNFKQILVDLDGTLVDAPSLPLTWRFIKGVVRELIRERGFWTGLKSLYRAWRAAEKPHRSLTNAERMAMGFSRAMGFPVERGLVVLASVVRKIFPRLEKYFSGVPGAKQFIDAAARRWPLVLATNPVWTQDIIELRVKWAGIDPSVFRSITHVERMHACKPSTLYYEELLMQEGFHAGDTLLVGNDYKNDLPATRIGVSVFIVSKKPGLRPIQHKGPDGTRAWAGGYADLMRLLELTEEGSA